MLGFFFLALVHIENDRTVLRPYIVALFVEACRIVRSKENLQDLFKRHDVRLIDNLDHFCVARVASADLLVGRVFYMPARIARFNRFDAFDHLKYRFGAPKTPVAEYDFFGIHDSILPPERAISYLTFIVSCEWRT